MNILHLLHDKISKYIILHGEQPRYILLGQEDRLELERSARPIHFVAKTHNGIGYIHGIPIRYSKRKLYIRLVGPKVKKMSITETQFDFTAIASYYPTATPAVTLSKFRQRI